MVMPAAVVGILATAFCLLFYLGLLYMVSHADGWQAMAAHFAVRPGDQRPSEFRRFVSAHLRGATIWQSGNFDFSMRTAETASGFYIVPHCWAAYGHRLLFIPWDAIQTAELRTLRYPHTVKAGQYVEIHFAAPDLDRSLDLNAEAVTHLLSRCTSRA
jgi:hypothetical protein